LEAIGYTCWPFVVSAGDVGANHPRKRSWLIGFNARDAEKDGWGAWRTRGRVEPTEGLSVEVCGDATTGYADGIRRDDGRQRRWSGFDVSNAHDTDAEGNANTASIGHEGRRPRRYGQNGYGSPPVASANVPNPNSQGQLDGAINGEMGGSESTSPTLVEPWADWNGGLAHHLRVDDGLSAWVASARVAVGGPRGTVAASLIVEAFGDAVVPQIPEAIGRAISRVEAALAAVCASDAANDNTPIKAAA
jgi:DNA (cytosine-5)-methyltransferase 1